MVLPGSFPSLRVLFGGDAFGDGGRRFALFIQSGLPTATAFAARWAQMRGELGPGIPDHGPLSLDAAMAGARLDDVTLQDGDEPQASRLQRALTAQLEEHAARALDRDLRQLPPIQALGGEVPAIIPASGSALCWPWRVAACGRRAAPSAAPF